jgi:acid stress-induced BolA-like protein IbaG/YrbA
MRHSGDSSNVELEAQLRATIEGQLPGSRATIEGTGGHFVISVVWQEFEGLGRVQRQRRVYSAIKEFMAGVDAPVHAVDRLVTVTPGGK